MVTPFLSTPLGEKSEETADVNISSEGMGSGQGTPVRRIQLTWEVFEPGLSQNPTGQFSSLSGKQGPSQTSHICPIAEEHSYNSETCLHLP